MSGIIDIREKLVAKVEAETAVTWASEQKGMYLKKGIWFPVERLDTGVTCVACRGVPGDKCGVALANIGGCPFLSQGPQTDQFTADHAEVKCILYSLDTQAVEVIGARVQVG